MPPDAFASVAALEGVPSAMAAARDGIDAVLARGGVRRGGAEVTGQSLLCGAAASAALEGSRYRLEELQEGKGNALARGAVRLSTQLLSLLPVWRTTPLQALARMHALAAGGISPPALLGRPRDDAQAAARLAELAAQLVRPTVAPALVVAALVHAEIAEVAPFPSANGVVARAAERLVLVARGVDPACVTVPEAGHLALAESYRQSLQGYPRDGSTGVRNWLLYAARAYERGAAEAPSGSA